jgi:hypothetical protein
MFRILPVQCGGESYNWWVYPDLRADWEREQADPKAPKVWRECDRRMFWNALEVLPPILLDGIKVFMVSEPYTTDAQGRNVYAMFVETGSVDRERYFARYVARAEWREQMDGLSRALSGA